MTNLPGAVTRATNQYLVEALSYGVEQDDINLMIVGNTHYELKDVEDSNSPTKKMTRALSTLNQYALSIDTPGDYTYERALSFRPFLENSCHGVLPVGIYQIDQAMAGELDIRERHSHEKMRLDQHFKKNKRNKITLHSLQKQLRRLQAEGHFPKNAIFHIHWLGCTGNKPANQVSYQEQSVTMIRFSGPTPLRILPNHRVTQATSPEEGQFLQAYTNQLRTMWLYRRKRSVLFDQLLIDIKWQQLS